MRGRWRRRGRASLRWAETPPVCRMTTFVSWWPSANAAFSKRRRRPRPRRPRSSSKGSRPIAGAFWSAATHKSSTRWCAARRNRPTTSTFSKASQKKPAGASRREPEALSSPSGSQHLGARGRLEFTGIHGHREHTVIADRAGQLDQPVIAEAGLHLFKAGVVGAMPAQQLAREIDDLGVFRRDAARVVLADCRDRLLRHAETARAAGLRAPDIDRLEFARDRHCRQDTHAHIERALETDIGA